MFQRLEKGRNMYTQLELSTQWTKKQEESRITGTFRLENVLNLTEILCIYMEEYRASSYVGGGGANWPVYDQDDRNLLR